MGRSALLWSAERSDTFRRTAEFLWLVVGVELSEFRRAAATLLRSPSVGGPPATIVESGLGAGLARRGGRDQLVAILLIGKRVTDGRLASA